MVTRYFLRSRVLQGLYSYILVEKAKDFEKFSESSIILAEKEFSESLGELHKLYIILLYFLVILKIKLKNRIKYLEAKKFFNVNDNLLVFLNNRVIDIIESNREFIFFLERYKLKNIWEGNDKLFDTILDKLETKNIQNNNVDSMYSDVKNLANIYHEFLCNNEYIDEVLEFENIYWGTDIWAINGLVLKSINNVDFLLKENKLLSVFKDNYDKAFAERIFSEVLNNRENLEKDITDLSKNWDNDRISEIDMILIKMGLVEARIFRNEIPSRVILNEYIEISKEFSSEKSYKFVNGILNNYFKKIEI